MNEFMLWNVDFNEAASRNALNQMSNNKRKVDRAQIESMAEHAYIRDKNTERNLRRRVAYNEVVPEKKAALLERRRAEYADRKRRHSENSAVHHSAECCSSAEPRRKIPRHAAIFISDTPSLPVFQKLKFLKIGNRDTDSIRKGEKVVLP